MLRMLVLGGDRAFGMVKYKNMVIDQVNLLTNLKIEKHRGRNFLILNKNYSSFEYDAFLSMGILKQMLLGCFMYWSRKKLGLINHFTCSRLSIVISNYFIQ